VCVCVYVYTRVRTVFTIFNFNSFWFYLLGAPVPESNTPLWTEQHTATVMYFILSDIIKLKDSSDLPKYIGRELDGKWQTTNTNYIKLRVYCDEYVHSNSSKFKTQILSTTCITIWHHRLNITVYCLLRDSSSDPEDFIPAIWPATVPPSPPRVIVIVYLFIEHLPVP